MTSQLVTICTNRKRRPAPKNLDIHNLGRAPQEELLLRWVRNVENNRERFVARDVYCGRGFLEAQNTAAFLQTSPMIISAGLGLIGIDDAIPAYNATLATSSTSSIRTRVRGDFRASEWWIALNKHIPNGRLLSDFIRRRPKKIFLVTLSSGYAELVGSDLNSLQDNALKRIRIIGLTNSAHLPERLRPCMMPYDVRFDGPDSPCAGTRSDFPQRTTRHFAECVLRTSPRGGLKRHIELVSEIMDSMRKPKSVTRKRLTDEEIKAAISKNWKSVDGSSSRMLRLFRDSKNIACEQKRFSTLFDQVKQEMTST